MNREPRCLLRLRRAPQEWETLEFGDFEEALSIWRTERQSSTFAMLHIGFEFPDVPKLKEISERFEGCLALSAAAYYSLPERWGLESIAIHGYDGAPLYLAGPIWRTWGTPETTQIDEQWIQLQITRTSDFVQKLSSAPVNSGLHGESLTTFILESFLPHVPEWMWSKRIDSLNLDRRTVDLLLRQKIHKIETIGNLIALPPAMISTFRNFGPVAALNLVEGIAEVCQAALEQNSPGDWQAVFSSQGTFEPGMPTQEEFATALGNENELNNLSSIISSFLETKSDRDRLVFDRRFGVDSVPQTLEAISREVGITRERVRQIESQIIRNFMADSERVNELINRTTNLFSQVSVPLPIGATHHVDPWFANSETYWGFLIRVLENRASGIYLVTLDGTDYLSRVPETIIESSIRDSRRLLNKESQIGQSREHLLDTLRVVVPSKAAEFFDHIWNEATEDSYFAHIDGTERLVATGRGAESAVLAALRSSEHKLHYSEIQQSIRQKFDREYDIRRVHNAAAEVGILLGRGTYGLRKHIPHSDEFLEELASEARAIAESDPNPKRQWHSQELIDALEDAGVFEEGEVDKYQIGYALKTTGLMQDLKRMVWSLDASVSGASNRLDLYQAVIAILQEAGKPLTAQEIRERIQKHRGVGVNFILWPDETLIKVDKRRWGLNPRDAVISPSEQDEAIGQLVSLLETTQKGLHISEVGKHFPNTHNTERLGHLLFSLSNRHPKLNVARGAIVYLREWEDPRRLSIRQAVLSTLQSAESPLNVDEIHTRTEKALERQIDRLAIYGTLNEYADYTEGEGWKITPEVKS